MNILKILVISFISLLTLVSCNGQEKESYWKAEIVERISGEPIHGVTLGFMQTIAEQRLRLMKKGDSLTFHYPFERKVKTSELKSISNFDLLLDSDKKFDSVYNVGIESGNLKIKFKYTGTSSNDKNFVIEFKKTSKQEYFTEIEKIKTTLKELEEKISPFRFNKLNLDVAKPEYFNENDLKLLSKKNQNTKIYHPSIQLSDFGGKNPLDIIGLAVKFDDDIGCAATYKQNCFESIEYLWNEKNNKPAAIVLSKKEKQNKSEIVKLFKKINTNLKNVDFMVWNPNDNLELNWISETEVITLVINDVVDLPSKVDFEEIDIYGTSEYYVKLFMYFSKAITKSKISVYILSKELDNSLRTQSGGKSGKFIDYEPYYKNYR